MLIRLAISDCPTEEKARLGAFIREHASGFPICVVCRTRPSPTVDCFYCCQEFGLCDPCLMDANADCPVCEELQP